LQDVCHAARARGHRGPGLCALPHSQDVEKIVERLAIYPSIPQAGLVRQSELLQLAADNVAFMVGELRKGTKMDRIRESNEKLQLRRARRTR